MTSSLSTQSEPTTTVATTSTWRRLAAAPATRIFGVLVLLVAAFTVLRPTSFATPANAANIAADAAILLVLAVGATYVILTAGIDLSVSGVLVFSGVIAAKIMQALGGDGIGVILLGLLGGLVAGAAWGALNGFLVAKARIPALIVTLGTLGMSLGSALLLTGGIDVREVPLTLVLNVGSGRVAGIPALVVIAALVALVAGVVLAGTRFGRYTYAIGSNAEALRRAGVDTARHLIKVYALAGALAGLAGFLSLARFATTTLAGHSTDNLQTIAAVVIGGTSLFGGVGTVVGSVIGVFIPTVLQNGFVVLGVSPFWQQVAVGAVLIAAVYLDQLRRRARSRG
ncbi:ABC transporter permease [Pseudonocardia sichuanensis]|uniref:Monosaccharide ABC transporter membrane protein (CUT2 family) n=1 Tax=Pseudonocardia kunmingensis TaxID=630975 RepID=A0A543DJK1_9PSEU|nr:ABC transporter permease [Pseudonocardia kunmingensis]TQM09514.1 monosaccharide ABC transporter membrane protein (CUT2 family) [Pseudonocardia kunmingensis]